MRISEFDLIGTNHDVVTYEGTKIDLYFYTPEDVPNIHPKYKEIYKSLFTYVEALAKELDVECPALSIRQSIILMDPKTKLLSKQAAFSYSKHQYPNLERTVILLAFDDMGDSDIYLKGVLAHELRHMWQDKNKPEIRVKNASGYWESLTDEAEIDADAYAINFIASNFLAWDFENAADILCPYEKEHNPEAYTQRLERAMTYCTNHPKIGFIFKLLMKLTGKNMFIKKDR